MMLILLGDLHWKAFEDIDGKTALAENMEVEGPGTNEVEWPYVFGDDNCGEFEAKSSPVGQIVNIASPGSGDNHRLIGGPGVFK
jgi:hypothetical protein